MFNSAFSVVGRLLSLCKSMPTVTNTSSSDSFFWCNSINCDGFKVDRFKLIAKFSFVSVSEISTYRSSVSAVCEVAWSGMCSIFLSGSRRCNSLGVRTANFRPMVVLVAVNLFRSICWAPVSESQGMLAGDCSYCI